MALATINDLLPNEHILNFYSATPPVVPSWLVGNDLKIMMGAGDLKQGGVLNVNFFRDYNVFFCEPWDDAGSLRQNVEVLLREHNHEKVICFIDINNMNQIELFTTLFAGRFGLIDGFDNHTPHFSLPVIEHLLRIGGEAVNIDERSERVYSESNVHRTLARYEIRSDLPRNLTDSNIDLLEGTVYNWFNNDESNEMRDLNNRLYMQIEKLLKINKVISVDKNLLMELIKWETFNTRRKFSDLQKIAAWLLKYKELPPTLRGNIVLYKRLWKDRPYIDLVLTKVAAGGRRIRKTRRRSRGLKKKTKRN
jgi:hypothetical protein